MERLLWDSQMQGTAKRVLDDRGNVVYARFYPDQKYTRKRTEAEDNAIGRRINRRKNRALRGWRPYAQR